MFRHIGNLKKSFRESVYEIIRQIPKGKVITYKAVAQALNCKAYRAVGNALNKNRSRDVPCHRVVKSNGSVGGFASGKKEKIRLLREEGIRIKNEKILNFDEF